MKNHILKSIVWSIAFFIIIVILMIIPELSIIDDWNPHILYKCLDSVWAAKLQILLCFGIIINYIFINQVWKQSVKHASNHTKIIFTTLRIIFITCSIGGYASRIISLSRPETAYLIGTVAMLFDNIACILFNIISSRFKLTAIGKAEKLGSSIIEIYPSILEMNQKEKDEFLTEIITQSVKYKVNN